MLIYLLSNIEKYWVEILTEIVEINYKQNLHNTYVLEVIKLSLSLDIR